MFNGIRLLRPPRQSTTQNQEGTPVGSRWGWGIFSQVHQLMPGSNELVRVGNSFSRALAAGSRINHSSREVIGSVRRMIEGVNRAKEEIMNVLSFLGRGRGSSIPRPLRMPPIEDFDMLEDIVGTRGALIPRPARAPLDVRLAQRAESIATRTEGFARQVRGVENLLQMFFNNPMVSGSGLAMTISVIGRAMPSVIRGTALVAQHTVEPVFQAASYMIMFAVLLHMLQSAINSEGGRRPGDNERIHLEFGGVAVDLQGDMLEVNIAGEIVTLNLRPVGEDWEFLGLVGRREDGSWHHVNHFPVSDRVEVLEDEVPMLDDPVD